MTTAEKLEKKLLRLPASMPFEDVERIIMRRTGMRKRTSGKHCAFVDAAGNMQTVPTVSGRHVKRYILKQVISFLGLEADDER